MTGLWLQMLVPDDVLLLETYLGEYLRVPELILLVQLDLDNILCRTDDNEGFLTTEIYLSNVLTTHFVYSSLHFVHQYLNQVNTPFLEFNSGWDIKLTGPQVKSHWSNYVF